MRQKQFSYFDKDSLEIPLILFAFYNSNEARLNIYLIDDD